MSENYPLGTNTANAPWNQTLPKEKTIEVTISITLSKTVKIDVDDYEVESDEYGSYYNFDTCDLKKAVKKQIILPNETPECKDWNIDDYEVVLE